jgi:methanogenic corrinoid protein MtbC1
MSLDGNAAIRRSTRRERVVESVPMSDQPPFLPPVDPAAAGDPVPPTTLTPEMLASLLADGDDELAAWTLRGALAERRRAEVFDGLLREAMKLIGDRWADGRWTIAEEHLASQTVVRALERVRDDPGAAGRVGPLAVLAGVAGEHHVIGLACLDQVLREDGWTVANLGPDLPAADLATFLQRNRADLVALTARLPDRLDALREAVDRARAVRPDDPIRVMVGGAIATQAVPAGLDVDWAGTSLVAASAFAAGVRAELEGRPPPEVAELP